MIITILLACLVLLSGISLIIGQRKGNHSVIMGGCMYMLGITASLLAWQTRNPEMPFLRAFLFAALVVAPVVCLLWFIRFRKLG